MSYALGEAAALTLLQALAAWDTDNSLSLANDSTNRAKGMLNHGTDYKYLFLEPGAFESGYNDIGDTKAVDQWHTTLTLIVFNDPPTQKTAEMELAALRQEAMETLDQRLHLNSSVVNFAKVVGGEPIQGWKNSRGRAFILQEMDLLWEEVRSITQND